MAVESLAEQDPQSSLRNAAAHASATRVLLVLDNLDIDSEIVSAIHLANALADDHIVFLCNAQPERCDPAMTALVDERVLLIEGTLGMPDWHLVRDGDPWSNSARRSEVLQQLIQIHRIDVIDSRSDWSDRLLFSFDERMGIPWFTHLKEQRKALFSRDSLESTLDQQGSGAIAWLKGIFHVEAPQSLNSRGSPDLDRAHPPVARL